MHRVPAGAGGVTPAVAEALASGADAVAYSGDSPRRAARCARALREAGFSGPRVTVEPVMADAFFAAAGEAGDGWVFAAGFVDAAEHPRAKRFAVPGALRLPPGPALRRRGVRRRALPRPGHRAPRRLGCAVPRRPAPPLRGLTARRVTRTIALDWAHLTLAPYGNGLFLYRAEGGRARYLGSWDELSPP